MAHYKCLFIFLYIYGIEQCRGNWGFVQYKGKSFWRGIMGENRTVDSKLLLRLPMNKFRDLRTYLTNHGIVVLASDRQMFKELKTRRKLGDDLVAVGAVSLPKTANAPQTDIAYVKVKEILPLLREVANIHEASGELDLGMGSSKAGKTGDLCNTRATNFEGELWAKIGGIRVGVQQNLSHRCAI